MLFSSPIFLFLFLPITLFGYYLSDRKIKNYFLLFASLVFFAWGGVSYTIILIASIVLNYIFGLLIQKNLNKRSGYWFLFAGVSVNILLLGVFKYANFITLNINLLCTELNWKPITETDIVLPVGISFYTFHSLSYLVDIYRQKTLAQKNIFNLALYISMFSQLIAGPIIRYSDVWEQLTQRTHSLAKFSSGVERFLIGLAKKVLLANTFGRVADILFAHDPQYLSALSAWLAITCYTLQIYLDFAGYSDMAIGLGRMFGFEFMENFNFPYIAKSVKEFWRRWHISLSTFFRDYVYIPLGGNRVKKGRQYLNLIIVFLLTGFWHGASWNFVVWGLFHGFFLLIERLFLGKVLEKTWGIVSNLYTLLVVMFAWVLFRADTLDYAVRFWGAMFHFELTFDQLNQFSLLMNKEFYTAFVVALLGCSGFFKFLSTNIDKLLNRNTILSTGLTFTYQISSVIVYAAILILCSLYLISNTYNPFIYYKF